MWGLRKERKAMNLNPNVDEGYAFQRREDFGDGPWEECVNCRFPAPVSDFTNDYFRKKYHVYEEESKVWLCQLCASQFADILNCGETRERISAMCLIGNHILYALGAFGPLPEEDRA